MGLFLPSCVKFYKTGSSTDSCVGSLGHLTHDSQLCQFDTTNNFLTVSGNKKQVLTFVSVCHIRRISCYVCQSVTYGVYIAMCVSLSHIRRISCYVCQYIKSDV